MADLKTDYKDDVLDTEVNELRKYRMIQNEDGTVSFEDVTEYLQVGDSFGSADINETNAEIEEIKDNQEAKYQELENAIDTKVTNSFTANRAVYANANGELVASGTVTGTELGYLDGVTSSIQTQLNNKVTTATQARLADITLGDSGSLAYIYQQNEDIKFRFKGANGTTKYTTLDTLVINIGNHGTSITDLQNRFGKVCKTITDWNAVTENGFYMASGANNSPLAGTWFMGIVIAHNPNYVIQELYCFVDGPALAMCRKYTRRKYDGSWLAWVQEPQFTYNASTGTLDITL